MKHTLRAFALGILITTLIIGGYFVFIETDNITDIAETDMISSLNHKGYHVFTNEELSHYIDTQIDLSLANHTANEDTTEENIDDNDADDPQTEQHVNGDTSSFILTIEPGMTVSEVSNYLIIANLIESREQFVNYLSENGYATNIQVGSFELHRDMSMEEVVNVIATKR